MPEPAIEQAQLFLLVEAVGFAVFVGIAAMAQEYKINRGFIGPGYASQIRPFLLVAEHWRGLVLTGSIGTLVGVFGLLLFGTAFLVFGFVGIAILGYTGLSLVMARSLRIATGQWAPASLGRRPLFLPVKRLPIVALLGGIAGLPVAVGLFLVSENPAASAVAGGIMVMLVVQVAISLAVVLRKPPARHD